MAASWPTATSWRSTYADCGGEFNGEADYGAWHIDDPGIEGGVNRDSRAENSEVRVGSESFTVLDAASAGCFRGRVALYFLCKVRS